MKSIHLPTIFLSIFGAALICTLFLGFNYLEAQWSGAPANPPNGNVAAPIHTGGGYQEKAGGSVPTATDRIATGQFIAGDMMRSNRYCDVNGNNCFGPGDVGTGGDSTFTSISCPAGQSIVRINPDGTADCGTASDANFASCTARTWSNAPLTRLPAAVHGQLEVGGSDSSYPAPGMYQCLNGTWVEVSAPVQDRNR